MASPQWHALWIGKGYNPLVMERANVASGAYAIRDKASHEVLYVGESSRGTIWKTMLRHVQAPESFRRVRESGVLPKHPEAYEVALHITSRGHRPRETSKRKRELARRGVKHRTDADQRAMFAQSRWIERLKPSKNKDDGNSQASADEYRAHLAKQEAEEAARPFFDNPRRKRMRASFLNPNDPTQGALIELGKLTRLEPVRGRALRWSLREAPSLSYDGDGRLFLVYTGRIVRSSTPAEIREYGRTHWGKAARGHVRAGGIAPGPFVRIGAAKSITYTTKKGIDSKLVDYVHAFGEGASAKGFLPPQIVEHECVGGCRSKCAARGALALHGGSYRVTSRGIVG